MSPNRMMLILKMTALTLGGLAIAVVYIALTPPASATKPGFADGVQEAAPFNQEQKLAELRKQIAGKETQPAEQVWKNIQQFKGMPAGRLLNVMNAFTRALGVTCTHCHIVDQWEKDDIPKKQIAREMAKMVGAINADHIKKIANISPNAAVSCSTCHRGQPKPDSNLPSPKTDPAAKPAEPKASPQ